MEILENTEINKIIEKAQGSDRQRQHYNLHSNYAAPCQVLLNAICPESYIQPHRHTSDPKSEYLFWVSGDLVVFYFSDSGKIKNFIQLGPEAYKARGVKLISKDWHTVVALADNSVILEVKAGPFIPDSKKDFAFWAPAEGSASASQYLLQLKHVASQKFRK